MRLLFLALILMLSGCSTVGKAPKFPDAPSSLMVPCQELVLVKDNETKLSEVLKVVTTNYSKYHECSIKVESWIEWHKQQKNHFEELK
jgi:hypothetical protein